MELNTNCGCDDMYDLYFILLLFFTLSLSSLTKLANLNEFKQTLVNIDVSRKYIQYLVYLIPLIELLLAIFLLIDKTRLISVCGVMSLFIVFAIKLSGYTKKSIRCNCFGKLFSEQIDRITISRLIVLTLIGLYLGISDAKISGYGFNEYILTCWLSVGTFMIYALISALYSLVKMKEGE